MLMVSILFITSRLTLSENSSCPTLLIRMTMMSLWRGVRGSSEFGSWFYVVVVAEYTANWEDTSLSEEETLLFILHHMEPNPWLKWISEAGVLVFSSRVTSSSMLKWVGGKHRWWRLLWEYPFLKNLDTTRDISLLENRTEGSKTFVLFATTDKREIKHESLNPWSVYFRPWRS
jgi:hypothetical protein